MTHPEVRAEKRQGQGGALRSLSRLSRFRESDVLRHVFVGLVKGEGTAVDASVLEANTQPLPS